MRSRTPEDRINVYFRITASGRPEGSKTSYPKAWTHGPPHTHDVFICFSFGSFHIRQCLHRCRSLDWRQCESHFLRRLYWQSWHESSKKLPKTDHVAKKCPFGSAILCCHTSFSVVALIKEGASQVFLLLDTSSIFAGWRR